PTSCRTAGAPAGRRTAPAQSPTPESAPPAAPSASTPPGCEPQSPDSWRPRCVAHGFARPGHGTALKSPFSLGLEPAVAAPPGSPAGPRRLAPPPRPSGSAGRCTGEPPSLATACPHSAHSASKRRLGGRRLARRLAGPPSLETLGPAALEARLLLGDAPLAQGGAVELPDVGSHEVLLALGVAANPTRLRRQQLGLGGH